MDWTDERVALLKTLWGQSVSASEIAKRLGDTTRNAVIGKAHRLGLSRKVAKPAPEPQGVTVRHLSERMCRWPIGHPGEPGFRFCGHSATTGRPYCEEHCAVAYRRKDDAAA